MRRSEPGAAQAGRDPLTGRGFGVTVTMAVGGGGEGCTTQARRYGNSFSAAFPPVILTLTASTFLPLELMNININSVPLRQPIAVPCFLSLKVKS